MTDQKPGVLHDQEPEFSSHKYAETFSPVVVTEGVGAIFLGVLSLLLVIIVKSLLVRNKELEKRLREVGG